MMPEPASKAPSSPTGTMAGSEQRPDHTGVIRDADEAEARYAEALTMEMREPWHRDLILGMIASCTDVDKWASSMAYTYSASGTLEVTALIVAMRAEIERLRAQLNEATNVPDAPTEPAPELERDPNAPSPVGSVHGVPTYTPMCRVHPEHFMPCSRCLGYGCTACDNGIQAADDRRSL